MRIVQLTDASVWDAAVAAAHGHVLQTYAWGELKSRFGWSALRLAVEVEPQRHGEGGADAETGGRGDAGVRALSMSPRHRVSSSPHLPISPSYLAGAQVLFRQLGPLSLAYIPRGPWGDLHDRAIVGPLLAAVHAAARRRRAIFLKLEPPLADDPANAALLSAQGFYPSAQRVQPVSTIVVDLTADMATISTRLKPKWRYNIGLAARKGVTVRQGDLSDLPAFYSLMEITGQRDDFGIHSAEYYRQFFLLLGEKARLFLAYYQEQLLAGIAVTAFGHQAIYMYGASSDEQRNLMPNHLLQWEAIQWAQAQGCREYDLWGIPDTVPSPKSQVPGSKPETAEPETWNVKRETGLEGVYRFKSGFGGQVVRTVGAWDYTYSRPLYWLYTRALPWYRRSRQVSKVAI